MRELTATQRRCLAEIETKPGTPSKLLPGGTQTVIALMMRGRAEVQGEDWRTFLPTHTHLWITDVHLDACHFFENRAHCDCGVRSRYIGERSMKTDPYSSVWYDDADECARCKELREGARPRRDGIIARPENYQAPVT